jgi:hypothetical protein
LSSDLYIGVTFANFQSSGNIPVQSDRLNTSRSDLVIVLPACFISLVEILSRPVDFPFAYFVFLLSVHNLICYENEIHSWLDLYIWQRIRSNSIVIESTSKNGWKRKRNRRLEIDVVSTSGNRRRFNV